MKEQKKVKESDPGIEHFKYEVAQELGISYREEKNKKDMVKGKVNNNRNW